MANYTWMAQVGGRHVAMFNQDGSVELRPRDGDPIIIDKPDGYDELVDVSLDSQAALALQFQALAEYAGRLRRIEAKARDFVECHDMEGDHLISVNESFNVWADAGFALRDALDKEV